jgi:hypothetical protein
MGGSDMTVVLGKFLAVAEFEGDVLDALDRVEAIRNRAAIGGGAFADGIERAYQALVQARYEVDAWKVGGDEMTAAGTRVRLLHDIDRYPHFIATAGSTGTVVDIGDPDIFAVKLDEELLGAEEWENEVHWSLVAGDDPTRDVVPLAELETA